MTLKERYSKICKAYEEKLNKMWDTNGEWIEDDYRTFWVADCYIGNHELRYIVDNGVSWDDFYEWYNYTEDMHIGVELGKKEARLVNIEHWFKGFPEELKVSEETRAEWRMGYYIS